MFPIQFDSSQISNLLLVAFAMVLGALIGLDREVKEKPAGLRTHMLVSGAAALLVTLGDVVIRHYENNVGSALVSSDPIRIVEAVITGVTFLGAGTIIRSGAGRGVEGLTTAASLLLAAAVGIAVALSQFLLAAGATIIALVTLTGIQMIERQVAGR